MNYSYDIVNTSPFVLCFVCLLLFRYENSISYVFFEVSTLRHNCLDPYVSSSSTISSSHLQEKAGICLLLFRRRIEDSWRRCGASVCRPSTPLLIVL